MAIPIQDPIAQTKTGFDELGKSLSGIAEQQGPLGQYKQDMMQRLTGGPQNLSPMELQALLGVPAMQGAGTAGLNPFAALTGGAPGVGTQGAIPPELPQLAGNLSGVLGQPSPAAREQQLMDEETLRDKVAQINNLHVKMNTMLQLQGFKERLPIYDTKKLKFNIPLGQNVQRSRSMRAYSQSVGDILQKAQQSVMAMETAFAMGPDQAKTVIPDAYRGYLGNFPDTEADLQGWISGRAKPRPK